MKNTSPLLSALCLLQFSLHAQVTVAVPPAKSDVVVVVPATVMHRQLSMAPKVVIMAPATQADVSTKKVTTTVVETNVPPGRRYNSERNVVIVEDQGQSRELPYATLPVLFAKGTAKLLDNESRAALQQVADVILAVSKTEPNAVYDIEGHTSTDGTSEANMELSAARAKSVYDVLTQTYGVPFTSLSAHGYGEMFPMYPKGTDAEMQQDRRVLVVRTK